MLYACITVIRAKQPRGFIIENVANLARQHRSCLKEILSLLRNCGYRVRHKVLDSRDFGLPQSRPRIYIVGQRRDCIFEEFTFNNIGGERADNIDDFLIPEEEALNVKRVFTPREKEHIVKANQIMNDKGINFDKVTCCVDIAGSANRFHATVGHAPCITRARGSHGFYVSTRKRTMAIQELLMLQGFGSEQWDFEVGVANNVATCMDMQHLSTVSVGLCLETVEPKTWLQWSVTTCFLS